MNEVHQVIIGLAVAYTLLGAFIFTVAVVCLSLIGLVQFQNKKQQAILFGLLIVELVGVGLTYFNELLNTTKLEGVVLRNATELVTRKIEENAITYLHVPSKERLSEASQLGDKLLQNGYIVPEIKITGENTPSNNEVRFFYPHQKGKAEALFGHISDFGLDDFTIRYLEGYEGIAHKDTLEIWFGKKSE